MGHALNYVQLSTSFDPPQQAVCTLHGAKGYSVLVRTWTACYLQASPELDLSNDVLLDLHAQFCFVTREELRAILETCFVVKAFDREAWEERKVLTHRSIEKRLEQALFKRHQDAMRQQRKRDKLEEEAVTRESRVTKPRKEKQRKEEKTKEEKAPHESIVIRKGEKESVSPEVAGKIANIIKSTKASLRKESTDQPLTDEQVAARKEEMLKQLDQAAHTS